MWSFEKDDQRNRVAMRIGDSRWSNSQSFEAIGSNYEVTMASNNRQSEIRLGVNVNEGKGKVSFTFYREHIFCDTNQV